MGPERMIPPNLGPNAGDQPSRGSHPPYGVYLKKVPVGAVVKGRARHPSGRPSCSIVGERHKGGFTLQGWGVQCTNRAALQVEF